MKTEPKRTSALLHGGEGERGKISIAGPSSCNRSPGSIVYAEKIMIDFKPVAPADRNLLASYLLPGERRDSNLSVASLCCWQFLNCSSYALIQDQLVIRFCFSESKTVYTIPAGEQATRLVMSRLARQAMEEERPLYLYGILPEMKAFLDKAYPEVFEYRANRDHYDYLYRRSDLATLKGKDYQTKRNHVNKFQKTYDYRYTPLTVEMLTDCQQLYDRWCQERRCQEDESLVHERTALIYGMEHFQELGLRGGALWVDGRIIAFTFGAPVNYDTFCIHAEKALTAYEGAYNAINKEFAAHLPETYLYLNREEDLGVPGLRKAKESYRPLCLLEKGLAICAEGTWERLL